MPNIIALYRHPIKGLSPEPVAEAMLEVDGFFPFDRLFALENGPSGFDPAAPMHLPKTKFLMLMRNERLAALDSRYDPTTGTLVIRDGGRIAASGDVSTEAGRRVIEAFFESTLGAVLRGPVRLVAAPSRYRFVDWETGNISILNRATIGAIAASIGRESLDPRRFRGNILIDGLAAFAENDLVGQRVRIGAVEFEIIKRINRCAAIDVEPGAGIRNTSIVPALERNFGHHDCGIYARIVRGGTIRVGDEWRPAL